MAEATDKARASAPGQYLGYALQPVRLCFHLLNGGQNSTASIEHLDDVALRNSYEMVLLEQTKSALKQNPISDWSEDLWKTFGNWMDSISSGLVDPASTRFQLYVTPMRSGYWAQRLSDTNFPDDVLGLISDLREAVDSLSRRPKCYKNLRQLFDADSRITTALVSNFRLRSEEDPIEPIRNILRLTVQEEILEHFCAYAIGLAKQRADSMIRVGQPAVLDTNEFRRDVRAFIAKNNLARMLPSFATSPAPEVIEQTLDDQPMFVRQLNIVDMPHSIIVRAIGDFLQSASDKTDWAEKGLVVNDSLLEFDTNLMQQYELKKLEIDELHGDLELAGRGILLYSQCTSTSANLDGREVPSHFVPGCYNGLADRLELGWHPSFASILDEDVH